MARTVKETRLDSRTARRSLRPHREPYWRMIGSGAHIGYRRHQDGSGSWIGRLWLESKKYVFEKIGAADDVEDADGLRIFNFTQAQEKCRQWFSQVTHEHAGQHYGPYTVNTAIDDYMRWFSVNRKSHVKTLVMIDAFIRPKFGNLRVDKLSSFEIQKWLEDLATSPPRKRVQKGALQKHHFMDSSEEAIRKRKATANRYLNVLKAILNKAYEDSKVPSDVAWRRVKPFKKVDSPRMEYLEIDELKRFLNVCSNDFRKISCAAFYTGCRYSELGRMVVSDYNSEIGKVHIRTSKSGNGRFVVLTKEAQEFFKQNCFGKKQSELIFTKENDTAWSTSHQHRRFRQAMEKANISKKVSFHSLRHTYASHLAMNSAELLVISKQLGHSDTRMVERHYAHLAQSYVTDRIRECSPELGVNEVENIVEFKNQR